jgi:hypothetical protein
MKADTASAGVAKADYLCISRFETLEERPERRFLLIGQLGPFADRDTERDLSRPGWLDDPLPLRLTLVGHGTTSKCGPVSHSDGGA